MREEEVSNNWQICTREESSDLCFLRKNTEPVDQGEIAEYYAGLRQFIISGKRIGIGLNIEFQPAILAASINNSVSHSSSEISPGSELFNLLRNQLERRREQGDEFLTKLRTCISGIDELLTVYERSVDTSALKKRFDFASEMISFDKMSELAAPAVSSMIPGSRLQRLHRCISKLKGGVHRAFRKPGDRLCFIIS